MNKHVHADIAHLEKLTLTQLVKKCPAFFMEPEGSLPFSKSSPLDPILSQPNPVRPIESYLPKVILNDILPPMSRSFQSSLASEPLNQNTENTSPLPHRPRNQKGTTLKVVLKASRKNYLRTQKNKFFLKND
jgi:hypothetical protein